MDPLMSAPTQVPASLAEQYISRSSHHKHSRYLIENADLRGFQPDEIAIMAYAARYHRKALPKKSHTDFQTLPKAVRNTALKLAALLRLAEGKPDAAVTLIRGVVESRSSQQEVGPGQRHPKLLGPYVEVMHDPPATASSAPDVARGPARSKDRDPRRGEAGDLRPMTSPRVPLMLGSEELPSDP